MNEQEATSLVKQGGVGSVTNNVILNVPSKSSNEMLAMTKVISYLSEEAEKTDEVLDLTRERDWNKKINERFISYKPQIMNELQTLTPLYKDKYRLAWSQSNVSEGRRDEINALLSIRSRSALTEANGDPIKALDGLTKWLCEEASKNQDSGKQYSEAAVRFFLHTEFQRCNVFPNEVYAT